MKGILATFALFFVALLLLGCTGQEATSTPTEDELEGLEAELGEIDSLDGIYGEELFVDSGLADELSEASVDEAVSELNILDISVGDEYDSLDVDVALIG